MKRFLLRLYIRVMGCSNLELLDKHYYVTVITKTSRVQYQTNVSLPLWTKTDKSLEEVGPAHYELSPSVFGQFKFGVWAAAGAALTGGSITAINWEGKVYQYGTPTKRY